MIPSGADEFRDSFFQECEELLESMHDGFEQLASDNHDAETIHAVFRAVHSIKGGAGAFGLDALVAFAHHFETTLDRVRAGEVEADDETLELFKVCGDHLSDLVSASREDGETDPAREQTLREKLNDVIGHDPALEPEEEPDFEPQAMDFGLMDLAAGPPEPAAVCYDITFTAQPGLFSSGNEPALLFRTLAGLGKFEVTADLKALPALDVLEAGVCHLSWKIRLETEAGEAAVREVFDFVEDCCTLEIDPRDWTPEIGGLTEPETPAGQAPTLTDMLAPPDDVPDLADLLAQRADGAPQENLAEATADGAGAAGAGLAPDDVTEAAATTDASGEAGASGGTDHAPARAAGGKAQADQKGGHERSATIRVDLERVDKLINLVGELVIKEAMLSQSIAGMGLPSESDVSVGLENLRQLAGEIQEGVMAIRAQPVKPMFQRMARIVREAAAATGKRVKFVTNGEYTEVDKTVIERLLDPMTHMIRNAVDHGLEDAETRVAAGKSAEGTVVLSAAHRSGRVMIDISDDGGGIKRDKVQKIAEDKGLIPRGAELSAQDIDNLLFLPGFSSKEEVSELSGRGVGLDVARSEIQSLGGRVAIQSVPGEGTTFSISLPLTLAVLEGMVVDVAGQTMVVPITAIEETLRPKSAAIHGIGAEGRVMNNRDSLVPIVDLGAALGLRPAPRDLEPHILLVIEADGARRAALVVDNIQDQRQVVIKSLETNYRQIAGIAAATILGDGRIALIIDPDNIVRATAVPAHVAAQVTR